MELYALVMLVFIDESGHPTPNDAATKPVLVAVCISEREVRNVSRRVYAAKRSTAGRPEMELKAVNVFNRHTLRRKPEYWVLAREVLEICLSTPITVFGISMDRPTGPVPDDDDDSVLPAQFRFLLGRVNQFCDEEDDRATILFDDPGQRRLARTFSCYLFRSGEGQSMSRIADAPYFVDSKITTGIQIADLIAGGLQDLGGERAVPVRSP